MGSERSHHEARYEMAPRIDPARADELLLEAQRAAAADPVRRSSRQWFAILIAREAGAARTPAQPPEPAPGRRTLVAGGASDAAAEGRGGAPRAAAGEVGAEWRRDQAHGLELNGVSTSIAVQRRAAASAAPAPGGDPVIAAATAGVATASAPLPHREAIQRSFGRHDVHGVRAQIGGPAIEATRAVGAVAYTTGAAIAFARDPDLHLAAHEAAHVVQQRMGVQLAGGVGRDGDAYENHANAVADAVVRGESAEAILDQAPTGGGGGGGHAVQRYEPGSELVVYPNGGWMIAPHERPITEERHPLARALRAAIPAPTRGTQRHLVEVLPAAAHILDTALCTGEPATIIDPASRHNYRSYAARAWDPGLKAALAELYKGRWESRDARTRRQHLQAGRHGLGRLLMNSTINHETRTANPTGWEARAQDIILSKDIWIIERIEALLRETRFEVIAHDGIAVPPAAAPVPGAGPAAAPGAARAPAPRRARAAVRTPEEQETDRAFEAEADALIQSRVPAGQRAEYDANDEANSETESGRRYQASARGTSAGQPASLGRGQLLVRLQVGKAIDVMTAGGHAAELITTRAGLGLAELREIDRLGDAAMGWYDGVTGSGGGGGRTAELRALVGQGPSGVDQAVARFGGAFTAETGGLPADELRTMAAFRGIRSGDLKAEYRELTRTTRAELQQLATAHRARLLELVHADPAHSQRAATIALLDELGDSASPALAAIRAHDDITLQNARNPGQLRTIVMQIFRARHPELNTLLAAHAGDRNQMTEPSLELYLNTSTDAEDRNGWYTRGAMQSAHWAAFERLLPSLDIYTTQERSTANYTRAVTAARAFAGFDALAGDSRAIFLGQMARMNHGGSARFDAMYLGRGRTESLSAFRTMIEPHSVDDVRTLYQQIWEHGGDLCAKIRRSLSGWTGNYLETQEVPASAVPDRFIPDASGGGGGGGDDSGDD